VVLAARTQRRAANGCVTCHHGGQTYDCWQKGQPQVFQHVSQRLVDVSAQQTTYLLPPSTCRRCHRSTSATCPSIVRPPPPPPPLYCLPTTTASTPLYMLPHTTPPLHSPGVFFFHFSLPPLSPEYRSLSAPPPPPLFFLTGRVFLPLFPPPLSARIERPSSLCPRLPPGISVPKADPCTQPNAKHWWLGR